MNENRNAEEHMNRHINKLNMIDKINIRNERESDYETVETITRKAFYNVYVPGCMEHYLVHIMRNHEERAGYGKMLIRHSLSRAAELGYDTVVILGNPSNYVSLGFQSCRKYSVCIENGKYPAAMLVKELVPGALKGEKWIYSESPAMAASEEDARKFDDTLEKMEKKYLPSQEAFYIMSNSFVE